MYNSLEETIGTTCPKCGKEHEAKFFSLFVGELHYIIGDCTRCGYRIEFRRDDLGGGLFLPDGNPVTNEFDKNTQHMKEGLQKERKSSPVVQSFSGIKMRIVDE